MSNQTEKDVNAEVMEIMDAGHALIDLIESNVRPGRERSIAITNIETGLMWASAGRFQEAEEAK